MYLSGNHRAAFDRLRYGIDSGIGFIVMTGEVGTGKTTILRTLLTGLDPERYRSALIFNPCVSSEQLLESICREFSIQATSDDGGNYLDQLNCYLLEEHAAGRIVVLVIDEAQNLAPEVLEKLRLISNLETDQSKMIQIILAGQPEFSEILERQDLRQLKQRIAVRCQLKALSIGDTSEYISHRLKIAGCRIPQLFSYAAIRKIYRFSRGTPRLINIVCEQSLVLAWTREEHLITPAIVGKVIRDTGPKSGNKGIVLRFFEWLIAE
jgi:general secretion pathway protein A